MARRRAQLVYEYAERAFTERSKSLLTTAPNPQKKQSTVKITVFGMSSCVPPLIGREGKLVWSADEVPLLSKHINATKCRDGFSSRIFVTLLRFFALLPSGLALFSVCFWI